MLFLVHSKRRPETSSCTHDTMLSPAMPAPAAMMRYRTIFSSAEMFCASVAPPHPRRR